VKDLYEIPRRSADRKVNELVKRVRAARTHALIISAYFDRIFSRTLFVLCVLCSYVLVYFRHISLVFTHVFCECVLTLSFFYFDVTGHLKRSMPNVFGKEKAKENLLINLEDEFYKVRVGW
jgi:hypothetical protein